MKSNELRSIRRDRRRKGIRKRIVGTAERPRLTVHRSHKNIAAQLIDDDHGTTIVAASSGSKDLAEQIKYGGNVSAAKIVGAALAEKAKAKGIEAVCFDRNGYKFHGRVKGLADAAREGGLKF